jgi:hypothetical protein
MLGPFGQVPASKKRVDSTVLNLLGVQPMRAQVAGWVSRRILRTMRAPRSEHAGQLLAAGITSMHPFLPQEQFAAIQRDFHTLVADPARATIDRFGETVQRIVKFRHEDAMALPSLRWFVYESGLFELLRGVEGDGLRHHHIVLSFEHLTNGRADDPDPNKEWHTDTFYSTHKAWLYLDDVTPQSCPFSFAAGSHLLTLRRLKYEYLWSLRASKSGSWRLSAGDQSVLLGNIKAATGPSNTLVVANTFGFHRRGDGLPGAQRLLLRVGVRRHPFKPF